MPPTESLAFKFIYSPELKMPRQDRPHSESAWWNAQLDAFANEMRQTLEPMDVRPEDLLCTEESDIPFIVQEGNEPDWMIEEIDSPFSDFVDSEDEKPSDQVVF